MNLPVRVRFAPSPTGHLHIGSVRAAMFNWIFARHSGGAYLLRVEDTDLLRSKKEYLESQLASLAWFGLLPDEDIVYQMSRAAEHVKAAQDLMNKGFAYPCFCQPRDADEVVEDLEQGIGNKYAGTCRNKEFSLRDLQQPYAIRFKVPDNLTSVEFQDVIRGKISIAADQLDDFVIIRRDGSPIYNFCVVVDDIFMNITHVIRGEDHISNTHKQVLFYKALGAPVPLFAHLPLILGQAGNKLSKRDASVSVEEYRAQGFMADALFNYLVRLGWSHGDQEVFSREQMVEAFELENVGKKGAIFDIKKLLWLNGVYIRQSSAETLLEEIRKMDASVHQQLESLWERAKLYSLIDQYKQRATTLVDLASGIIALASDPAAYDLSLIEKWRTEKTGTLLAAFDEALAAMPNPEHDQLLSAAKVICEAHSDKLVSIAQPLRLALTGSVQSPGVFELIQIMGKEISKRRIHAMMKSLSLQ
jgi:glutamyl-tRNA synthetase